MSEEELRFYNDYKPSNHVSERLLPADDDIDLKVPQRDILGLLESQEVWSSSDAISAAEIRSELVEWEQENRPRAKGEPTVRTVRNQLSKLEERGLVRSHTPSNTKQYWKIPDDEIGSPIWNQAARRIERSGTHLEGFFYRNGLTLLGVGLYFVGSSILFLAYISQSSSLTVIPRPVRSVGARIMFAGIGVFLFGHIKDNWWDF